MYSGNPSAIATDAISKSATRRRGLRPAPITAAQTRPFAHRLSDISKRVFHEAREPFGWLYRELGVPADPFDGIVDGWSSLRSRPFRLLHTDVHRKNMIIRNGRVVFIDWELALYGDPVYDVATHLHKMAYFPAERDALLTAWTRAEPAAAVGDWAADLQIYLSHERIKSVVVDAVRYTKVLAEGSRGPEGEQTLVESLVSKLAAGRAIWGQTEPVDPERVEAAMRSWR